MLRCAIYTRKSSEEGLSQAFNSLHAQREACEAYVRSQAGEGWLALPQTYDDGGFSGGGMDRPALRRLLADVAARRIDVVTVYKVDRLTRSLADFARIIEVFEKHQVAFVSITQAFNTTGSMGRLTLNILLSFAQFERDVTGERIRDKIAASKAKGMWMGGNLPLGYDAPASDTRALQVNAAEAASVRHIFMRYLETGGLLALQERLAEDGVRSKRWISTRGRLMGGYIFSRGALRHLLQNRVYVGEITHKGATFRGRHEAIVDTVTFDAAQALLSENSRRRREHVGKAARALLRGLLFDADGQAMEPVFASAHGRHYAYYASPQQPLGLDGAADDTIRRTAASAIEDLVTAWACRLIGLSDAEISADLIRRLVARVEIQPSTVEIVVRNRGLPGSPATKMALGVVRAHLQPAEQVRVDPAQAGLLRLILPIRLVLRGGRKWVRGVRGRTLVLPPPNKILVRQLRRGHAILRDCEIVPGSLHPQLRARAPRSTRDRGFAELALLAPDVQRAILSGEIQQIDPSAMPLSWAEQRKWVSAVASSGSP